MPSDNLTQREGENKSLLSEASPHSLDELFSRDPLELSEQDLDTIIAKLREERERFAKAEAEGKRPPRASKSAPKTKGVSLEDIGL